MWVRAALLLSALLFVPASSSSSRLPKAVAIQACGAAAFAAWLVRSWQILLDWPSRALAPARRAVALYPDEAVARSEWHDNDHDRAAAAGVLARLDPPAGARR
jgi:hypothetical protein